MSEVLGLVIATADPELVAAVLDDARARFPDVTWGTAPPDRLGETRRRDPAWVAVVWDGQPHHRWAKLRGLACARRHLIYNANLDIYRIGARDRSWLGHLRWQLGLPRGGVPTTVALVLLAYRHTLGLCIGAVRNAVRFGRWRARWRARGQ